MTALAAIDPLGLDRYGAAELQRVAPRNLMIALCISVCIHLLVVGGYALYRSAEGEVLVRPPRHYEPRVDLDGNQFVPGIRPPVPASVPAARGESKYAVPKPVPDNLASADATIKNQHADADPGQVGQGCFPGPVEVPLIETPPKDFVPFEKPPQPIVRVSPVYPEAALRTGLEGRVWVKIWVDIRGKARDAKIIKSDLDIFNDACLEAARQFIFTPAVMNDGPVACWVAIPFNFSLREGKR